jgi:hypothetical protein
VWNILPCSARTGDGLQESESPLKHMCRVKSSTVLTVLLVLYSGMEWLVEQINSGKEESKN